MSHEPSDAFTRMRQMENELGKLRGVLRVLIRAIDRSGALTVEEHQSLLASLEPPIPPAPIPSSTPTTPYRGGTPASAHTGDILCHRCHGAIAKHDSYVVTSAGAVCARCYGPHDH